MSTNVYHSYPNLANDVRAGSQILVADGSISLEVLSTDPASGTVQCRCLNTAMLGYVIIDWATARLCMRCVC